MAELQVFRLQPRGAFHFGSQGVGLEATTERCPSDTLYAALLIEARRSGDTTFPLPAPDGTVHDPPFRLSSCLPYAGDTLLFPPPRLKPPPRDLQQPDTRKRAKQLRYVSLAILRRAMDGGNLDERSDAMYQDGAIHALPDEQLHTFRGTVWKETRVDHVTVDRRRAASQYYAVGQVRFAPRCGLFVLAETRDAAARDRLFELLTRLGHSGLGGKRSIGLGQFDVCPPEPIDLPAAAGGDRALLLSRYLPRRDELDAGVLGDGAAYDLIQTGGWLHSDIAHIPSLLRKPIHLLREGSIIRSRPDRRPVEGRAVDLRPDIWQDDPTKHAVWRYGLALTVGIAAKERT